MSRRYERGKDPSPLWRNKVIILTFLQIADPDERIRFSNITKACKIIADIMPNLDENYQIRDNMKELLPKLIKSLSILRSPVPSREVGN